MKRGDVYWADIFPRSGSEQTPPRPVIIVSHDAFNQTPTWQSIIIVPITTSGAQRRRGVTAIELPRGAAGLQSASVAVCHQVTTLDRAKLNGLLGTLSAEHLRQVEDGLRAALDIE